MTAPLARIMAICCGTLVWMFSICVCGRHVKDCDHACPFCGATERSKPRPGRATRRIAALAAMGINSCVTTVPVYGDDDGGFLPNHTTSSSSGTTSTASGVVTSNTASTGAGSSSSSAGGAGGSGQGGAGGSGQGGAGGSGQGGAGGN